jgi:Phosphoserine phosphatase RsbU, N-terminal domain
MDAEERLGRDYQPLLLRYVSQRDEGGRRAAYELGRAAMAAGLGILTLVRAHHTAILRHLRTFTTDEEREELAEAASEFLAEVLSTFDMTHRGFLEAHRDESGPASSKGAS